jgi:hypothetical protein
MVNHDTTSANCCSFHQVALQRRAEDADDLPIDVVDRRREEEQRADRPAVATDLSERARREPRRAPDADNSNSSRLASCRLASPSIL